MRNVPRIPGQVESNFSRIRRIIFGHVRGTDGHGPGISDALTPSPAERVKRPRLSVRMREAGSICKLVPRVKTDDFRVLLENLGGTEILS